MIEVAPEIMQGATTGGVAGAVLVISQRIHLKYMKEALEALTGRVLGLEAKTNEHGAEIRVLKAINGRGNT